MKKGKMWFGPRLFQWLMMGVADYNKYSPNAPSRGARTLTPRQSGNAGSMFRWRLSKASAVMYFKNR